MMLHINNTTTIRDLQEDFSKAYPFLKIDFFNQPHGWGEMNSQAIRYNGNFRLIDIEKIQFHHSAIEIHPWTKVGELEQTFKDRIGLYVQVSRRLGDEWIQTAGTDDLNIDEQNEIGKKSNLSHSGNLWIEREPFL
jgi:hypothetical protein